MQRGGTDAPKTLCGASHLSFVDGFYHEARPKHLRDLTAMWNATLISAAKTGDLDATHAMLRAGADPNAEYGSPLLLAVENRHSECVRVLLQYGADVSMSSDTPLSVAVAHNCSGIVEALIKSGAEVSRNDDEVLRIACRKGFSGVVGVLLAHGADVNAQNGEPIEAAVEGDHAPVVRVLLQQSNMRPDQAQKGLKLAARKGMVNSVLEFVQAPPGVVNVNDYEVVAGAARGAHFRVLHVLAQVGDRLGFLTRCIRERNVAIFEALAVAGVVSQCVGDAWDRACLCYFGDLSGGLHSNDGTESTVSTVSTRSSPSAPGTTLQVDAHDGGRGGEQSADSYKCTIYGRNGTNEGTAVLEQDGPLKYWQLRSERRRRRDRQRHVTDQVDVIHENSVVNGTGTRGDGSGVGHCGKDTRGARRRRWSTAARDKGARGRTRSTGVTPVPASGRTKSPLRPWAARRRTVSCGIEVHDFQNDPFSSVVVFLRDDPLLAAAIGLACWGSGVNDVLARCDVDFPLILRFLPQCVLNRYLLDSVREQRHDEVVHLIENGANPQVAVVDALGLGKAKLVTVLARRGARLPTLRTGALEWYMTYGLDKMRVDDARDMFMWVFGRILADERAYEMEGTCDEPCVRDGTVPVTTLDELSAQRRGCAAAGTGGGARPRSRDGNNRETRKYGAAGLGCRACTCLVGCLCTNGAAGTSRVVRGRPAGGADEYSMLNRSMEDVQCVICLKRPNLKGKGMGASSGGQLSLSASFNSVSSSSSSIGEVRGSTTMDPFSPDALRGVPRGTAGQKQLQQQLSAVREGSPGALPALSMSTVTADGTTKPVSAPESPRGAPASPIENCNLTEALVAKMSGARAARMQQGRSGGPIAGVSSSSGIVSDTGGKGRIMSGHWGDLSETSMGSTAAEQGADMWLALGAPVTVECTGQCVAPPNKVREWGIVSSECEVPYECPALRHRREMERSESVNVSCASDGNDSWSCHTSIDGAGHQPCRCRPVSQPHGPGTQRGCCALPPLGMGLVANKCSGLCMTVERPEDPPPMVSVGESDSSSGTDEYEAGGANGTCGVHAGPRGPPEARQHRLRPVMRACRHYMCLECACAWLIDHKKQTCPLCRARVAYVAIRCVA